MSSKPEMIFYHDRLNTFVNWPIQMIPSKTALAQCGFYYTGSGDRVACFACDVKLHSWDRSDNPWVEHESHSPMCLFLKMYGYEKVGQASNGFVNRSDFAAHSRFIS
jgi:hypothetical protein